jgi:hypothetical protein
MAFKKSSRLLKCALVLVLAILRSGRRRGVGAGAAVIVVVVTARRDSKKILDCIYIIEREGKGPKYGRDFKWMEDKK